MDGAHSVNCHGATSSVVIDDFNVCRPCIRPLKADAKLTIDPDAVLTSPVTVQCLKPVTRRGSQVSKLNSSMQHG
jgi:hypothetical protein